MIQAEFYRSIHLFLIFGSFVFFLVLGFYVYRFAFRILKHRVLASSNLLDDFILELFRVPALWILFWVLLKTYTHLFFTELPFYSFLLHLNSLWLIFSFTWIAIKFVSAGEHYLQNKLDLESSDNLHARKSLTQIKVFKAIANSVIVIIALSVALMTFEEARNVGISLLTSAGVVGVVVGFAAQKSIGMILAGIQLAITQPIRLDDVVIVEGEWGRIEEITLTYVVVRIWDQRRLVLPVTWFLEQPFQNWTRQNAEIMGTVFLYVDYLLPVDPLREFLKELVGQHPDWDGRVQNIQVTGVHERYKELRVLLSSEDSSKNWNLRVAVREQMIDFIARNYPDAFAKVRLESKRIADKSQAEKF